MSTMSGDVWYDPDLLSAILAADKSASHGAGSRGETQARPTSRSGDPSPAASPVSSLVSRLDNIELRLSAVETLLSRLSESVSPARPAKVDLSTIESRLDALTRAVNKQHDVLKSLQGSPKSTESDYESYLTVLEAHMKSILDRLDALEKKLSSCSPPSESTPTPSKSGSSSPKSPSRSSRKSSRSPAKSSRGLLIADISDAADVSSHDDDTGGGDGSYRRGVYI